MPGWVLILWIIINGNDRSLPVCNRRFAIAYLHRHLVLFGMLEPVLAGVFAWIWLEQSWNGIQLLGAAVVLVGIYIADRARSAAA